MGSAPTHRRLACGVTIGILLAACATANGDADGAGGGPDPAPARKRRPDETPSPPPFEATIEEPDGGDGDGGKDADPDPPPLDAGPCVDDDDPGSAENLAKALPDTDDCDDAYKTVKGVANGAVDVDFYKLSVADRACGLLQPDLESLTPGAELCVFVRCKNITAGAVTGCDQGTPSTSSGGLDGCCANGGKAIPRWDCAGLEDSADLYLRVRQPNGSACLQYELRYVF